MDFQASPRFLHALWWSKPTLQTSILTFRGGQNFKLLQATYRITMVKTEYPRFYKPSTSIAVSNMDFQNFYKLPTHLAGGTYHCGGQYGHYKIQQGWGMLCSGENRLVQPSITHCWGHNWQSKALQTFYTFCGSQNELFKLLPSFALVNSDSQNSTSILDALRCVKTDSSNILRLSERTLKTSTSLLQALTHSKRTNQNSTSV